MTTQGHTTTVAWVDLVDELTLVDNVKYSIQNVGPRKVKLIENASEPSAGEDIAHSIMPSKFTIVTVSTGLGLWVSSTKRSQLVITEG